MLAMDIKTSTITSLRPWPDEPTDHKDWRDSLVVSGSEGSESDTASCERAIIRPTNPLAATLSVEDSLCVADQNEQAGKRMKIRDMSSTSPQSPKPDDRLSLCDDSHESTSINAILRPKRSAAPPNTPSSPPDLSFIHGVSGSEASQAEVWGEQKHIDSSDSWTTIPLDEVSPSPSVSRSLASTHSSPLLQTPMLQDRSDSICSPCDEDSFASGLPGQRLYSSTPLGSPTEGSRAYWFHPGSTPASDDDTDVGPEPFLGLGTLGLYTDSSGPYSLATSTRSKISVQSSVDWSDLRSLSA